MITEYGYDVFFTVTVICCIVIAGSYFFIPNPFVKYALIAVAGGVRLEKVPVALSQGADILVVGRAITNAKDVREVAEQFINSLNKPEIDQFRIMTDF